MVDGSPVGRRLFSGCGSPVARWLFKVWPIREKTVAAGAAFPSWLSIPAPLPAAKSTTQAEKPTAFHLDRLIPKSSQSARLRPNTSGGNSNQGESEISNGESQMEISFRKLNSKISIRKTQLEISIGKSASKKGRHITVLVYWFKNLKSKIKNLNWSFALKISFRKSQMENQFQKSQFEITRSLHQTRSPHRLAVS